MIVSPDESYSVAEAGNILRRSERQVRYLSGARLRGSKASERWTATALQLWGFRGIADEMMANWREYCRAVERDAENQ
ncbi:hypothetical protein [uncultured Paracoccus sp.]|uniref:hypothetical protein n=1 Tax=uncultured Paracoccus sp. TaxID=189685 RepID=UPI00260D4857|nr:hypothetical protein [uncultured Paracoccus sp.]